MTQTKRKSSRQVRSRDDQLALYDGLVDVSTKRLQLPKLELFFRRKAPTPTRVFATYWTFAKRRQDVFFSKMLGQGLSNSVEDSIISHFRFTNVYRASDRVSQYLIKHVLYDQKWSITDTLFRTLVFKFFNKIETWRALEGFVGEISWSRYNYKNYDACLTGLLERGERIYSAAYIMPSGKSVHGYARKHRNHLKIIEGFVRGGGAERIDENRDLFGLFQLLRECPCVGPFIGYQLAIDLNYSRHFDFSENDFVEAGPGALDGISKCFSSLGDYKPDEVIRYMTDSQEDAFAKYAPGFQSLWGRTLHLIDCQNIFCEVSKYSRVAHPEVVGSANRSRIKQQYRPALVALELPWYPPKWGLNGAIQSDARFAQPAKARRKS